MEKIYKGVIQKIDEDFIKPEGTIEITTNGEYDVTTYKKANVNVSDMLQARVDATNSCQYLFYEYEGDNVDFIAGLDTSNVTSMYSMFYGCSSLTTIPQFDTSSVTTMRSMFSDCKLLTSIPLFNTSNVTNMQYMFSGCSSLTSIPLLDTSKVPSMANMFNSCSKLTSVPQLDTSSVTDMQSMFYNCQKLTSVPQFDTSNVISMYSMFRGCYLLPKIDISYYNISSTSKSSYFAYDCYSLKALVIRSFGSSYALNSNAFSSCYHISGTYSATYNPNGDKDGYIYIPRNMIETLTSATNWSTHASQLRALEDYTLDSTTTGELDLAKMGLEEE